MKSSKAMDDYLAVERRHGIGQAPPFPTPSEVESVKGALSEDELSALRSRGTYTALGDYPEGWGPVPAKVPALTTANLIRYEWRAFPYSGTDMLNAEFSKGWEFCGSIGGNCILRRMVP